MSREVRADDFIVAAALLHDNGKEYTKTFIDFKTRQVTDTAHYYNHHCVGAYEALFYMDDLTLKVSHLLFACVLIEYHMRMYNLKSEKARKKIVNEVGEDVFYFLELLHKADVESH